MFLTIIVTVLAQGLTAGLLARFLGVAVDRPGNGAVIVGCNPLSLLIARMFQDAGESVVLIDTDAEACVQAEKDNIPVRVNSALDAGVLEEAGLASAGTFLAITNNGEVNAVIAQQAQDEFQPPHVLAVFPETSSGLPSDNSNQGKSSKTSPLKIPLPVLPLKAWNNRLTEGTVRLGETVLRAKGALMQRAHLRALIRSQDLMPLLIKREDQLWVSLTEDDWQAGDRIVYLLHDPKPKLLQRLSGGSRPSRLTVETVPTVEEVPLPTRVIEPTPPPPMTEVSTETPQPKTPQPESVNPESANPEANQSEAANPKATNSETNQPNPETAP